MQRPESDTTDAAAVVSARSRECHQSAERLSLSPIFRYLCPTSGGPSHTALPLRCVPLCSANCHYCTRGEYVGMNGGEMATKEAGKWESALVRSRFPPSDHYDAPAIQHNNATLGRWHTRAALTTRTFGGVLPHAYGAIEAPIARGQ